MHRPGDVSQRLGISANTLRLWSTHFEACLSPSAQSAKTEKGGAAQRRYTDDDLRVLLRAKVLLADGKTYEEVAQLLKEPPTDGESVSALVVVSQSPAEPSSLVLLSTQLTLLEEQVRQARDKDAALVTEVTALRQQFSEMNRNLARLVEIHERKPVTIWDRLLGRK